MNLVALMRHRTTQAILVLSILLFTSICNAQVKPIRWSKFKKDNPADNLSLLERNILCNTNVYALTTWYVDSTKYASQTSEYLDLGGNGEHHIRAGCSEAFALAVALKTQVYDEVKSGVTKEKAVAITVRLITSQAFRHKVNSARGWGDHWQSALWAAYTGAAGWMMWQELSEKNQEYLRRMVAYEANRFMTYKVPYLRDVDGKLLGSKDDSKSEENSWNAMILQVACAMMPSHPNFSVWMNKNIELLLSANARPQDVNSEEIFHGKKLKDILNGSNYNTDGTVTNHGRIHPDYMACTAHSIFNALMFGLALQPIPKAALFNCDQIYKTMVEHEFTSPPFQKPGGSIYRLNSDEIYYPQVNDWGTNRKMHFALMDCQMNAFNLDTGLTYNGKYWEKYHAQGVFDMQERSKDKRTYIKPKEDTYKGREAWVAVHVAQAYLTKWLIAQKKMKTTNKAY